ncbi:MAG: hypothetical protein DRQ55_06465 [Planctomycetota bacterium]|nr:MAG: hypothetical protein DRQ55_06465 [Planctomycetota bacterium]
MAREKQRTRRDELKLGLSTLVADGLHRALTTSYRIERLQPSYTRRREAGQDVRCIYATWHEMLWLGIGAMRGEGICVLVSTHRDGETIARVLERQGYNLARGSSTRGGAQGLRELLRAGRQQDIDLCVTADGPRGPRRELKDGVLFTAAMTGRPIVPLAVAVDRAWRLGSWDRLIIGKPFARVAICLGEELVIPRDADRESMLELHRPRLAAAMDEAERRCLAAIGQATPDAG